MNLLFLALTLFSSSPELVAAKSYAVAADYDKSEEILNKYNLKKYGYEYHYIKMVNSAFANNKKETLKYSQYLLDSFIEIPRRYYALAFSLRNEAESWKDEDLDDISRDMKNSQVRLQNGYGGPKTKQVHDEIIRKLDKQIKEMEDEIKRQQEQSSQRAQGKPKENNSPIPQDESKSAQDSGPGVVQQKKLQYLRENWGKLPEKERTKAMMEITRDLPPRYREVIEAYFRTLANSEKDRP